MVESHIRWLCACIQKGMYGLPQAGIIAQQLLKAQLVAEGYHQSTTSPGYRKHDWQSIFIALCRFWSQIGLKGTCGSPAENIDHPLSNIPRMGWHSVAGPHYCLGLSPATGADLHAGLLYQGYATFSRHYTPQNTGSTISALSPYYANSADTSPPLNKAESLFVKEVIGVSCYYPQAVHCTMLTALGSLAAQQANPNQTTIKHVTQFLDYTASHPDTMVTYWASDMGPAVSTSLDAFPPNNGAVLTISQIIKAILSSTAEAELGDLYINSQQAIPLWQLLEEMGHPQPLTPIQIDNSTAHQHYSTQRHESHGHEIPSAQMQSQPKTIPNLLASGINQLGDYVTKHHPGIHHQTMHPIYLTMSHHLVCQVC
eukprot:CCRYP_018184-RA/>CCRYP_018184-RA protein AED:0.09 eAED:0.06 QI:0/0/0/1/0/0/4/0/369